MERNWRRHLLDLANIDCIFIARCPHISLKLLLIAEDIDDAL